MKAVERRPPAEPLQTLSNFDAAELRILLRGGRLDREFAVGDLDVLEGVDDCRVDAGLGAAALAAAVYYWAADAPSPAATFWSQYVGGGAPAAYTGQGLALHLLYGLLAGVVFAAAFPVQSPGEGLLWGVGYGVVLLAVGAVVWLRGVLDVWPDRAGVLGLASAHLVYGGALGLWVGVGVV